MLVRGKIRPYLWRPSRKLSVPHLGDIVPIKDYTQVRRVHDEMKSDGGQVDWRVARPGSRLGSSLYPTETCIP